MQPMIQAHRFRKAWFVFALMLGSGCSHDTDFTETVYVDPLGSEGSLVILGDSQWVDTGVDVIAGEAVSVVARGTVFFGHAVGDGSKQSPAVGPSGTFFFSDRVANKPFPLPSAARGPAPCYCLIGRIGDSSPFFVGSKKSWIAGNAGRLYLGVNDFDLNDNSGQFQASVTKPVTAQPIGFEERVSFDAQPGEPNRDCSVVVFYVDGLRPDVVREMAAMGHIPFIKNIFLDGGAWLSKCFTAFPSDTITSNGTMWTGCFSDRHGLKGQVRFSRRTLHSESYLEPLGPNRSARLLNPVGIDRFVQRTQAASIRVVRGKSESKRWQSAHATDVPPIYQHLRDSGSNWATGVLPLMTDVPPMLWTRSMTRHLPYLKAQDAWKYVDDANTHYALNHLLARRSPVTIIWLPETDSVSHKFSRGQFGITRRTIAEADQHIGRVVSELHSQGRLERTYLMLVSDHGHHGGRQTHLSHFDLTNELFHRPREMTDDGRWQGGGLGLSVRQHRFWNRHSKDRSLHFVFVDGDSDGAARIFLPRGHYRSGRWFGPSKPADMLAYKIDDHLPNIDLIDTLCAVKAVHGSGNVERPVDLVLMKLTENSILISTADRGRAVIQRKTDKNGHWFYKYTPVENVEPTASGMVTYQAVAFPRVDPLELLSHLPGRLLDYYHSEADWLDMTADSTYPDSVVVLTRHMLWQKSLRHREDEFAPDLVVTARKGWYFGMKDSPGTMHGYPLGDSMRATFFVAGPNIRRGARIDKPCRLVDLTPTILEMVGLEVAPDEFDGTPLRTVYQSSSDASVAAIRPVYWDDVDLKAWQSLEYVPLKRYEHLPVSVNRPGSAWDLNNIVYNILTIGDLAVLRLMDDVLSPLSGRGPGVAELLEAASRKTRRVNFAPIAEAANALNVTGATLGDYSLTSLGNLMRVDGALDWIQNRTLDVDRLLARPVRRVSLPGTKLANAAIDDLQAGFWEVYRFTQRVVVQMIDETLINSIENGTDRVINAPRRQPSEIIVKERPPFVPTPLPMPAPQ